MVELFISFILLICKNKNHPTGWEMRAVVFPGRKMEGSCISVGRNIENAYLLTPPWHCLPTSQPSLGLCGILARNIPANWAPDSEIQLHGDQASGGGGDGAHLE